MNDAVDRLSASDPLLIGDRIREARKKVGLSQVDLAKRVGVTQPAVANWESGVHDPRRLMLAKIGDALQRMRELAVQSANGTNNAGDRDRGRHREPDVQLGEGVLAALGVHGLDLPGDAMQLAHDGVELISRGRHERFVINREKFDARVGAKAAPPGNAA